MLAHTYRLRVSQRIRLLAVLTALGALLNTLGPRLIAHGGSGQEAEPATGRATEVPVRSPVVNTGDGKLGVTGQVLS
jgi:hypothetical protein